MTFQIDWEQVFTNFSDGLMITDQNFTVQFVNPAFKQLIGKAAQEPVGRKCHEIFSSAFCGTPACPLICVQAQDKPLLFDGQTHCKPTDDASRIITATAIFDTRGKFTGMLERIMDARVLHKIQSELRNSQDRMRKIMGAIIQAMSMTIEKRDPYTAGHQRRVAKLCRAIATEMGFSWERIQGLRMAAAIHDLGKINVPASILNKPGPMSEHEIGLIRMHPQTAFDILEGIEFPWPLAETIYQHHERLDGSGYPRGLKGDQILLEARILAVADVVESITFFRPYRELALGMKAAIRELRKQKGILYDARVVDTCILLLTKKGFDFKTKAWQHPKQANQKPVR
ncbi:MAG: HD domain-containing phosphohydrolase [Desulfobacterales bacterium]|nr:HD domain-containing phosphohydrolase [Desulfobacterales bacterium]